MRGGAFLYAVLVGLVGAGIVHIVILLLLPAFAERDAWARLASVAETGIVVPLDNPPGGRPLLATNDPLFSAAACRFDLSQGGVRIRATGQVPYWSASIFDRSGENIYSLSDTAQRERKFDLVAVTGPQMVDLRKDMPADMADSVFVETPVEQGIVVVRAFVPDETWRRVVDGFMQGLSCKPLAAASGAG